MAALMRLMAVELARNADEEDAEPSPINRGLLE
jgi:hypothetical protein